MQLSKFFNNKKAGSIFSFINIFVTLVCSVFLSSFLIYKVGSSEYGVYQSVTSFISYLIILEFGLSAIMTRNLSILFQKNEPDLKDKINRNVSTILSISFVLSFAILAFSIVFYFSIPYIYSNSMTAAQISEGQTIFLFMIFVLLFSFLSNTFTGGILAYHKYSFTSIMRMIKSILKVVFVILFLFFIEKALVLAIADAIASFIFFLVSFIFFKKISHYKFSFKFFDKKVLAFSLPLAFALLLEGIVNQANSNVDKFVIGIIMKPEFVSIYSIGMLVYTTFASVSVIPISMFAPDTIALVSSKADTDLLERRLLKPARIISLSGCLIFGGFVVAGRQFITIFYGQGYLDAWIVAILLIATMLIYSVTNPLTNVLDALNKSIYRSIILLFTTILNIGLTIPFVYWYGIVGAAAATFIASFIGQVIILNVFYQKALKIHVMRFYKEAFIKYFLILIFAIILSLAISNRIENNIISCLVSGSIFVVTFVVGILLQEKMTLKQFISSLRK